MILHVMTLEKFTPLFIHFVKDNFDAGKHKFTFITSPRYEFGLTEDDNAEFLYKDDDFEVLTDYMESAEKIILHSLKRDKVHSILRNNPHLLKKCIWVMWGGDFYYPTTYNDDHLHIIENVPYLVNVLDEEIDMVRNVYNAKGKHIRSFFYNTTIFHECSMDNDIEGTEILLGHSAVVENRHIEYMEKLAQFIDEDIRIKCPLVYPKSNAEYRDKVIQRGRELFGDKFIYLIDFIPLDEYLDWIDTINIAVFPSSRQHGMGNLVNLLGSRKKVFLDTRVSTWSFFKRMGVTLYPLDAVNISSLSNRVAADNNRIIKNYFSENRLRQDLKSIFDLEVGENLELEI